MDKLGRLLNHRLDMITLAGLRKFAWLLAVPVVLCTDDLHAAEPPFRGDALVIGNQSYTKVRPLRKPRADAEVIAAALRRLGFAVELGLDLKKDQMDAALNRFEASLADDGEAFVYFSGHGMTDQDGAGFILPVDYDPRRDLTESAVNVNEVISRLESKEGVRIVVLDACRDLGKSVSSSGIPGVRTVVGGTFVGFAAAPLKPAGEGDKQEPNSLFTRALLHHLGHSGPIEEVFKRARGEVIEWTEGQQVPWDSTSLVGEYRLISGSTLRIKVPFRGMQVSLQGRLVGTTSVEDEVIEITGLRSGVAVTITAENKDVRLERQLTLEAGGNSIELTMPVEVIPEPPAIPNRDPQR